jgi:hypothetical protein
MGTHTNDAAPPGSEGASIASNSVRNSVSRVVTFQDQNASRNENPLQQEWQMPESVDLHSSGLRRSSRLAALHSSETIEAHSTSSKTIGPSSKFQRESIETNSTSSETIGSSSKLLLKRGFLKAASLALFSSICAFPVGGKTHCALIAAHASDVQNKKRDTKGRR